MDEIRNLTLSNKHKLLFDVSSSFTNRSLEEVINIICSHTDHISFPAQSLKNHRFYVLLQLCAVSEQFRFDDSIYRKIDGLEVEYPLGPSLADVFTGYLEIKAIRPAHFYGRSVYDSFVVIENESCALDIPESLSLIYSLPLNMK